MADRLEALGLPADALRRIRALGVDSAEGLRSLVEAAPIDLERHLGQTSMAQVKIALGAPAAGVPSSQLFDPDGVKLGAVVWRAPALPPAPPSIALRDSLFERLGRLRETGTPEDDAEVAALKSQLEELMDSGA